MVCTANDLHGWKDFPKGLRVLLLDEDTDSAAEIKSKLEEMEYIVVTYCNENDALSAISSKPETFHVAIVEVTSSNRDGNFKFLEAAKDLPTIMISSIHCLSTMMKCIALGAIEFLQKPLSEDKLRNIWQHVVHKAFNAGGTALPGSLKPIKESVASILRLEFENRENHDSKMKKEPEILNVERADDCEPSSEGNDKYPAPSTPQQEQGVRLLDDVDCHDQTNCSLEKDCGEQDGESKSVETTCINSLGEDTSQPDHSQLPITEEMKEEENSADGCRIASDIDHESRERDNISSCGKNKSKACNISRMKVSRKKLKVDWTPELHKKFVHAVEQLGVNQAIPSRILELMKVEGLTRHNIASHLQKYRMQKRHILPKEEDGSWSYSKNPMRKHYYPQRPVMAFPPPPYHSSPAMPVAPMYPSWGHMTCPSPGVQMWIPPSYPPWKPPEIWPWKSYQGIHADAWGCPVTPPPHSPLASHPQHVSRFENTNTYGKSYDISLSSVDLQLLQLQAEEEIDKVVKEAMSKPWLPLPLGLRPPSTESVLSELSRQGISTVPSHINGSKLHYLAESPIM